MKKTAIILLIILIIIIAGVWFFYTAEKKSVKTVQSFGECVNQGYPVSESFPRKCMTPDGRTFTEEIEEPATEHPLILVTNPNPGMQIRSPLTITGQARGNWYFEADFPITLEDQSGRVIAQAIATAQGEWMTTEFVPFAATLTFNPVNLTEGILVFHKDNPSGLQENDDQFRVPVKFSAPSQPTRPKPCQPTGCSNQICADEETITTCEFLPEYSCYPLARCERQLNGECGWTETTEFKTCIANL